MTDDNEVVVRGHRYEVVRSEGHQVVLRHLTDDGRWCHDDHRAGDPVVLPATALNGPSQEADDDRNR